MKSKDFFPLVQKAYTSWNEDKASRLAASLSYFTIFSLAPLLVVAIGIAAWVFREQSGSVQVQVIDQISRTLGETVGEGVKLLLENATKGQNDDRPIYAVAIGFLTVLLGASGLFAALQDSLNTIWGVEPKPNGGIVATIQARFVSFAMVLGIGFLLLVSLVLSAGLQAMTQWMNSYIGDIAIIGQALNYTLGFFITLLLFAAIYKVLPDVKIQWHDVWIGAAVTAFLFTLGRFALGWYLARPGVSSAYGPAGALVVLLLWVNYASQIMFFGAEFTKVYANQFGSKIVPDDNAVAISPEARAEQGLSPTQAHNGLTQTPASLAKQPRAALSAAAMAEERKNFEFTLAAVAGGVIMMAWLFRKK